MNNHSKEAGFTLIELMIVVAIIGILASVALPAYQEYIRSAEASTVLTQANVYKTEVGLCIQRNGGGLTLCDAGSQGISAIAAAVTGVVGGVISIDLGDIDGDTVNDTVTISPTVTSTAISWTIATSGGTDACVSWLTC